jgi:hypothetical protein
MNIIYFTSLFHRLYIKRASSSSFTRWTQIAFERISFEGWMERKKYFNFLLPFF